MARWSPPPPSPLPSYPHKPLPPLYGPIPPAKPPRIPPSLTHPQLYLLLYLLAPYPRAPHRLEKLYRTIEPSGDISGYETLPCWHDSWDAAKTAALKHAREEKRAAASRRRTRPGGAPWAQGEEEDVKVDAGAVGMERAEVAMSVVVPAFNEEERLGRMLGEAVGVLEGEYGEEDGEVGGFDRVEMVGEEEGGGVKRRRVGVPLPPPSSSAAAAAAGVDDGETNGHAKEMGQKAKGWEVLVVSDGSTDKTVETALRFAKGLPEGQRGRIRVVQLGENRGKGGAVTHGMRHVRGQYVVFADADGASRFEDLGTLVQRCQDVEDAQGRGVAVGSRAHLVGSEAVVKVCSVLVSIRVTTDIHDSAIIPSQPADALLSPPTPPPHSTQDSCSPRHSMRLQVVLARLPALHNTIHAFRGLDLRCRDADAG